MILTIIYCIYVKKLTRELTSFKCDCAIFVCVQSVGCMICAFINAYLFMLNHYDFKICIIFIKHPRYIIYYIFYIHYAYCLLWDQNTLYNGVCNILVI